MSSESSTREVPPPPRAKSKAWRPRNVGLYALMIAFAVPLLFPIYWMASASLKPRFEILKFPPTLFPTTIRWENYIEVFTQAPFLIQYWNSLYIGVINTASVLIVSSLAGYAFARMKFRARHLLFLLLLSALLMPEEVTILPLFVMMRQLNWIGTHFPLLVIPAFAVPAVTGTFLMRQFFLSMPTELEDAGRIDGLGAFGVFWHIALPISGPALATLGILTFLQSWNAFLEPLIFVGGRSDLLTLPLAIFQYTEFGGDPLWANQLAAATLSAVPMIIVFLIAQRYIIQGIATSGIKG